MNKYLQTRPSVYEESFKLKQMHLTGVSYQSEDVGVLTGACRFLSFHLYIVSRRKQHSKGAFYNPQFWNKNGWYGMLGIIRIVCIKKRPSRCAVLVLPFSCTKHHWKKPRTFGTMKLEAMFHCVQKCNLSFSQVETYLNPQRSSRGPPSWIFIRNILFILPLGAEWVEWRSVHSGTGMRNRKKRAYFTFWPFSFQICE